MILFGFFFFFFFPQKVIESKIILINYLISFEKFNIDPVFQRIRGIKDSLENVGSINSSSFPNGLKERIDRSIH